MKSEQKSTTGVSKPGRGVVWLRRAAWTVVGAIVFYAVVAGLILPPIVRSQAEKRLTALVGGPVTIGRVSFQPFALRARITDFRLAEPDGRALLTWSNVVADAELASVWRGEAVLTSVLVDRLSLTVRHEQGGSFNLVDLLKRLESTRPPSTTNRPPSDPPAVYLGLLTFTNGAVSFRDEALAEPFEARLEPIDFQLAGLGTRAGRNGALELLARGDHGETLAWSARVSVAPPAIEGTFRGESIGLPRPQPYVDRISSLHPTNGVLSFSFPFKAGIVDGRPDVEIKDATVGLTDLALVEGASGAGFVEVRKLDLSGIGVSLARREGRLGTLKLDGGILHVRRSPSPGAPGRSELNVRELLRPETLERIVRELTDWSFRLDDAHVGGFAVAFEDTAVQPAVTLTADEIEVGAQALSNASNAPPAKVTVGLRLFGEGRVKATAEGTLLPARARATLGIEQLGLQALAPYVAQYLLLDLKRGTFGAAFEAEYGGTGAGQPLLQAKGRLAVTNLAAIEAGAGTDFIRWEAVEANGLTASFEPSRAELEELVVRRLQTSLILTTNGQLNMLQLIRETRDLGEAAERSTNAAPKLEGKAPIVAGGSGKPAAGEGAPPFWEKWPVRLGKLKIERVGLFAADQFYGGGFRTSIESLDGEVRNVALPSMEPAVIDLEGRLTAASGFTLAGTVNPDPARFSTDLKLTTTRADLAQFTPYTVRFAGYPVTKGELTAEVRYQVEGDALKAENKLLIDQFTLGPKTPSPDAVDLPLKLGVALLKDSDGRINLDLPLTGSLSDPQFSLAPLVWQVVKNVIVKAALAPFKLLGSLFGGGSEDPLEYVDFTLGTTHLAAGQTNRLTTLVKALKARPQLGLVLLPGFDAAADRGPLADARVDRRLKKIRGEEIATTGAPEPKPEAVVLTAEDRDRLIPILFAREFGALPSGPPPATPPPATSSASTTNAAPITVPAAAVSPAETPPPVAPVTWTPAQMYQRLLETTVPEPAEFAALARERAEVVRSLLVGGGGLAAERLTVDAAATNHVAEGKARVGFRLE